MLMNELFLLYEKNKELAGIENDDGTILLPIAHSTNNAQVEIAVDLEGNFKRANIVQDENKNTIIPVTEDSGSRGAGIFPHPLCDKLIYVAGDYSQYVENPDDKKEKDFSSYFQAYCNQLESWTNSEFAHPKIKAVFNYINRKKIISDLTKTKVFVLDEKDKLNDNIKLNKIAQKDVFIRFIVEPSVDNVSCEVWKDKSLYNSWINFYLSKKTYKNLCYISGENIVISNKHPSKIRYPGDKAKLISSNDNAGFTYRGRFKDDTEAFTIGYETSQNAHNALKWLIEKQGIQFDSMALVAWESSLKKIPVIVNDTIDIFNNDKENNQLYPKTQKEFSDRLAKAILGYKKDLEISSKILILSLDAATPGRLSVKMFRDFQSSSFLDNIENWHRTCVWNFTIFKDKEINLYIYAPALKVITTNIYGTEQNGFIKVDDKILRTTIERLLPCVIDKKPIPLDIVKMAVNKASNPMAYDKRYNWNAVLEVASALVKKSENDKINRNSKNNEYKEVFTMALDENLKDRSYLYGRLLAVADRIEYRTFESGEDRQTNAKRYMSAFAQRPYKTWQIIYKKLDPYLNKLNKGESVKYQNLLQNIHDLFEPKDFKNNFALDGIYILGFECQGKDLRYKNIKENNEEATNE
ncbi:MAG: type I-C CRISPR-associated protein Cas8c/Csd1 [Endomicrobiaceae bacterium]|nr:type I-C CRISPR-associated protein Cas8c/Csd1 [Endomicrobiaceae bacterium]